MESILVTLNNGRIGFTGRMAGAWGRFRELVRLWQSLWQSALLLDAFGAELSRPRNRTHPCVYCTRLGARNRLSGFGLLFLCHVPIGAALTCCNAQRSE